MAGFRRVLFLIFTAIYIILCPLLILYCLGYVYNPVKQHLVRTGVLRLSTIPADASVFLEKSRFVKQTPTNIEEILPGSYKITLKKQGYKNWTHTVKIEGGKALSLDNILMIPQQWPVKIVSDKKHDSLYPLGGKHTFLFASDTNLGSFSIYGKDKHITPLVEENSVFAQMEVEKIYYISDNERLLVSGGSFFDRKVLYLSLHKKEPLLEDVTDIFNGSLSSYIWQSADDKYFYTLLNKSISRIDMDGKTIEADYLKNTKGFGLGDKWIYAIDPNDCVIRISPERGRAETLLEDRHLTQTLFSKSPFYTITAQGSNILFLGANGDFIVNRPPYSIAAAGVTGLCFNKDNSLLLYRTKKSLCIADFSKKTDSAFNEQFSVQTVYEDAENIRQIFWAYRDSHIIFNDNDNIYLLELLPQGANHLEYVCKVLRGTNVFYDDEGNILYYLDEKNANLCETIIIP